MDDKVKLIRLMKMKGERIKELTGVDFYFGDEDEKEILSWDDETARKAWMEIKSNIKYTRVCGLSGHTCPFCVYYALLYQNKTDIEKCDECGYGKRHGICFLVGSDYHKIKQKGICGKDLSNEWYKKIIEEIEIESDQKGGENGIE